MRRFWSAVTVDGINVARKEIDVLRDEIDIARDETDVARGETDLARDETDVARDTTALANDEIDVANDEINVANDEINVANDEIHIVRDEIDTVRDEIDTVRDEIDTIPGRYRHREARLPRQFNAVRHERDLERGSVLAAGELRAFFFEVVGVRFRERLDDGYAFGAGFHAFGVEGDEEAVVLERDADALRVVGGGELHPAAFAGAGGGDHAFDDYRLLCVRVGRLENLRERDCFRFLRDCGAAGDDVAGEGGGGDEEERE